MTMIRKPPVALFVERFSQQWVVRNSEGNFWIVPSVENLWEHRQQFHPTEESALEPVPGQYIHMLDLRFWPKSICPDSRNA